MSDNSVINILMAGVGGQGTLLASEILSEVLMQAGHDVKKAEVHGMAQRGGSVVSHVRFGKKVYSPIIPEGQADVLFGFELLETYRYLPLVKKTGAVVVNNLRIAPPSVLLGKSSYPQDIERKLKDRVKNVRIVDGLELAEQALLRQEAADHGALDVELGAPVGLLELHQKARVGLHVPARGLERRHAGAQEGFPARGALIGRAAGGCQDQGPGAGDGMHGPEAVGSQRLLGLLLRGQVPRDPHRPVAAVRQDRVGAGQGADTVPGVVEIQLQHVVVAGAQVEPGQGQHRRRRRRRQLLKLQGHRRRHR